MSDGKADLLVIHPHLDVTGGSEKLTQILLEELIKREYRVTVLSRSIGVDFPCGGNIFYEKIRDVEEIGDKRLDKILSLYRSLTYVIQKYDPRIVFSMIQEPVYLVLSKIINPGKRTAIYIHFPYEEEVTEENLGRFIEMYRFPGFYEGMYRYVDFKLTNSNYTARVLYERFGLESNVVYPAIPWDYFKDEPDLSKDPGPGIISVGRFVPHKRLDLLIRIFNREIKPRIKDSWLIIIGVPDERYTEYYSELRGLAKEARDVELIDKPLKPRELVKYYRRARAYVHLRIGEHFGMAPVEAMSQGVVPILPSKTGLAELLTHGWNGYIYRDDRELVEYLVRILRMDSSEYSKFRKRAYRKSLYFTPDRFVNDIVGYLGLIKT